MCGVLVLCNDFVKNENLVIFDVGQFNETSIKQIYNEWKSLEYDINMTFMEKYVKWATPPCPPKVQYRPPPQKPRVHTTQYCPLYIASKGTYIRTPLPPPPSTVAKGTYIHTPLPPPSITVKGTYICTVYTLHYRPLSTAAKGTYTLPYRPPSYIAAMVLTILLLIKIFDSYWIFLLNSILLSQLIEVHIPNLPDREK